jgi:hypothetical protein
VVSKTAQPRVSREALTVTSASFPALVFADREDSEVHIARLHSQEALQGRQGDYHAALSTLRCQVSATRRERRIRTVGYVESGIGASFTS